MKVAKRYAKALFELSTGNLDTVQTDMKLITDVFKQNPDFDKVLHDPTVSVSKKQNIVSAVFGDKVSNIIRKLIDLLAQKDRLQLLKKVATAFNELYKKSKGIKEAEVITAVPLTEILEKAILNKVKQLTGSNQIKLVNKINPGIIGGFILNIDDLRYDASVSGKLAKIKSKLVE